MNFTFSELAQYVPISVGIVCGVIALISTTLSKSKEIFSSRFFPILVFALTIAATQFAESNPQYGVASSIIFTVLGLSTSQYGAFILVSRAKERDSNIAIALTGLLSNSSFYLLFGALASLLSDETSFAGLSILFIPYFAGMVTGRLAFKRFAQTYDSKHNADATKEVPKETVSWFGKELLSSKVVTYTLIGGALVSLALSWWFSSGSMQKWFVTSSIVLIFTFIMNVGSAIVPRLINRDKVLPATTASLMSGAAYPFLIAYLISIELPMAFFLFYTFTSTLGSVRGKLISEKIEKRWKIRPDQGVYAGNKAVIKGLVVALLAAFIVIVNLNAMGIVTSLPANVDTPLWLQNTPMLVVVQLFCVFIIAQSFTHHLSSRFGKRNDPVEGDRLHARSLVAHGIVVFPFTVLQLGVLNDLRAFPVFLTVMVLSGTLGALLAKEYGERAEQRFGLKMT